MAAGYWHRRVAGLNSDLWVHIKATGVQTQHGHPQQSVGLAPKAFCCIYPILTTNNKHSCWIQQQQRAVGFQFLFPNRHQHSLKDENTLMGNVPSKRNVADSSWEFIHFSGSSKLVLWLSITWISYRTKILASKTVYISHLRSGSGCGVYPFSFSCDFCQTLHQCHEFRNATCAFLFNGR